MEKINQNSLPNSPPPAENYSSDNILPFSSIKSEIKIDIDVDRKDSNLRLNEIINKNPDYLFNDLKEDIPIIPTDNKLIEEAITMVIILYYLNIELRTNLYICVFFSQLK